jgi:hypothetical protein
VTTDLGISDRWTKPIAGSSDRDLRAERVVLLRHQAAEMERAALRLPEESEREAHLAYASRVAAQAGFIDEIVKRWDDAPYTPPAWAGQERRKP